MAYTPTNKTWGSEPLTSTDLNQYLRDQLDALKDPPTDTYVFNDSANWTTSSTTFVDIDATDLSLTITTTGGDVEVWFVGNMSGGVATYMNLDVDGSPVAADDGICAHAPGGVAPGELVSWKYLVTGLSAASHTIKLQWRVASGTATLYAGAGTANADLHGQFGIRETS